MKKTTTFTSKLGTTKGAPRSRIWIEGDRLTAAGFRPGTRYVAKWNHASLVLITGAAATDDSTLEERIVSGKGDKPIIDITGRRVYDHFGVAYSHVKVTYERNRITIRGAI